MTAATDEGKYRDITVKLVGEDGNAFAIIGAVSKAMRKAKISEADRKAYLAQLMGSGSYDELLGTIANDFDVR